MLQIQQRLNNKQIEKLSDMSSDVGMVMLASVFIPAVIDKTSFSLLVLGLLGTGVFWCISIWLRK